FLATRIDIAGEPPIVVVAKADLSLMESAWEAAGVQTAIADRWGIVFLSGNPDWKYRPLAPLGAEASARLPEERTYVGAGFSARRPILPGGVVLPAGTAEDPALSLHEGNSRLLARFSTIEPDGWRVLAATGTADTAKLAGFWALA